MVSKMQRLKQKPVLLGIMLFILTLVLTQSLTYQQYLINQKSEKQRITVELNKIKDNIQTALTYSVSATQTLSFIIKEYDNPEDFDKLAQNILNANHFVDVLQLTQKGIITHVYPLKGNEAVIGYDILADSSRNKEAFRAIKENKLFFAGPLKLKQGGVGVVGRLPIYIEKEFYGFATTIVRLNTLLFAANLNSSEGNNLVYQFSKVNPSTNEEEFFIEGTDIYKSGQFVSVHIDEGDWTLYVGNKEQQSVTIWLILFSILGIFASILAGAYTYSLTSKPIKLNELVETKAQELLITQQNYKSALERVSDAFISLDTQWCFTYMNSRAGNLFNRRPEEVIGKNIWLEFPESVNLEFRFRYYEAMKNQKDIQFEEYSPENDKWFENHVYPSHDGLTIYLRDVTENKKVRISLKQSEEKYKILFDKSPLPKIIYNLHTLEILEANQSAINHYGYTRVEFLTLSMADLHIDKNIDYLNNAKVLTQSEKSISLGNWKHQKKDKQVIDVALIGHRLLLGNSEAMIISCNDITDQLMANLQLINNEQRFRSLVQSGGDLIAIVNLNGDYSFVSPTFKSLLAYPDAYFENKNAFDFIHSEDVGRVRSEFDQLTSISNVKISPFRFKNHKEEWRWIETVATNLYDDPTIRGIVANSRDITDRVLAEQKIKENHEKLIKLTNKVPAVIYQFEMDSNGNMRLPFVSKGIETIWPELNADNMMQDTFAKFSIVHQDDQLAFNNSIIESYQNLSEWNIEFRTNKERWIQGSSRPERKDANTVVWYGYMQDITSLKGNAEQLKQLNEELKKQAAALSLSNQELERFAYVASHDLQEPLRMVSSFLQLLKKKYQSTLDAQGEEYINYAVDGANRMKQLILDLLAFSRIDTQGKQYESVDLNNTVRQTIQLLNPYIQENNASIIVEELPVLKAVPAQMTQLFQNLISNAIKYRREETPRITIHANQDETHWYFSIEDNGIGIDERFYAKIFIVFQRLHTRSNYSGTGIGLAICKKIVERHGGAISVKSEVGKGSIFSFSLSKEVK